LLKARFYANEIRTVYRRLLQLWRENVGVCCV